MSYQADLSRCYEANEDIIPYNILQSLLRKGILFRRDNKLYFKQADIEPQSYWYFVLTFAYFPDPRLGVNPYLHDPEYILDAELGEAPWNSKFIKLLSKERQEYLNSCVVHEDDI